MGVSQSLGLSDKLREAIAGAQQVLDSMDLRGKLKVDVIPGESSVGASSVESSIDRTEKNAREAAEKTMFGTDNGGSGPLNPTDKLVDALNRLLKTMEGLPESLENGGRRAGRRRGGGGGAGGGGGEDDEGSFVNPYLLQGMIQNPIGTGQSSLWSMLMGGSGSGLKPPGWMGKFLSGSSGEFSIGKALGAKTLGGEGGALSYMGAGAMTAAGVATFAAAFAKTMSMQNEAASNRQKDSEAYLADRKFGTNLGIDWRAGAWQNEFSSGGNRAQNGQNFWIKDIQAAMTSADVGVGALGDRGSVEAFQKLVNTGMNIGVDSSKLGSMLGAGVRSGSVSLQHGDGDMVKYLSLIENWTRKSSDHGYSTNEALQRMAEVNQKAQQGTGGLVTRQAMISLLSMEEQARRIMPEELSRTGSVTGLGALGADATSDTQRVMMMNQFLDSHGGLSKEGRETAVATLGEAQVGLMEKRYGKFAGTAIARQLTNTDLGRKVARAMAYRNMKRHGVSGTGAMLTMGSGDFLGDADAMELADSPDFLEKVRGLSNVTDPTMHTKGMTDQQELELAALGQHVQRLSSMTAETALSLKELSGSFNEAKNSFLQGADTLRMNIGSWLTGQGFSSGRP